MSLVSRHPTEADPRAAVPERGGIREVFDLAYPVVLTTLSTTAMGVVDSAMVGRLGATELAAVGFGGVWLWTLFALFYGAGTGVQTFVSQADGAGDARACGSWVWHGLHALAPPLVAVLLVIAALLDPWIAWMGTSDALGSGAAGYIGARLPGELGILVGMTVASFFRGLGDTRTPLYATLAGNLVNAVLDYGLIFGELGMPEMGVPGAGLATSVGHWVAGVAMLVLLLRPSMRERYATGPIGPDVQAIRRVLRTGAPIGGEWFLGMTSVAVFTTLVARMGDLEMAASQVFVVLLSLSFMQAMGISMAAATLVGRYVGAGDPASAERSFRASVMLGAGLGVAIAGLFLAFPEPLIHLFTDDPRVIALGAPLLAMGALFQLFDAIGIIAEGALRGAGDTRWPFLAHTLAGWGFFVPTAWTLGIGLGLGLFGAWCGGLIYVVALASLMVWRFRSGAWRGITI
jgi:MATE family multidrug resistance protein